MGRSWNPRAVQELYILEIRSAFEFHRQLQRMGIKGVDLFPLFIGEVSILPVTHCFPPKFGSRQTGVEVETGDTGRRSDDDTGDSETNTEQDRGWCRGWTGLGG